MDLLIISYYIPFPLNTGGRVSQYAFLDHLKDIHNITLALIAYTTEDLKNIEILQLAFPRVDVKAVQPFPLKEPVLEPQFSNEEEDEGIENKRKALNPWKLPEHEDPYFTIIGEPKYRQIIESLEHLLKEKKYDLIQVEFAEIIDLIYALPKNSKTVFVHHEIRFARLRTYLAANRLKTGPFEKYILNHVKTSETNLLNQYSAVIALSEEDKNVLKEFDLRVPVYASPFPIMENHFVEIPNEMIFDKLVFVGRDSHFPNKDAVQWYSREIEREIVEYNLVLHVIGSWKKDSIRPLRSKGIAFAGFVDDIINYCRNSVMIVPIRIGSGLRTKILYAMAQGIPVITTSMACEGIPVIDKRHVLIANTPAEMGAAVNYLQKHPEQLRTLAVNAQQLMREKFSQQVAGNLRNSYYEKIINGSKENEKS